MSLWLQHGIVAATSLFSCQQTPMASETSLLQIMPSISRLSNAPRCYGKHKTTPVYTDLHSRFDTVESITMSMRTQHHALQQHCICTHSALCVVSLEKGS